MFAKLLENPNGKPPACVQADAAGQFSAVLGKSHLRERDPDGAITEPNYAVVGIASYSPDELRLLDEVNAMHADWPNGLVVFVFDTMTCQSIADFERYLPGIGAVEQSPVVGFWNGSGRTEFGTGLYSAREILKRAGALS